MRVNRRRARVLVLALLLLSFMGPWEKTSYSCGVSRVTYFPAVAAHLLRSSDRADLLILAALVGAPLTCLAATLVPASRLVAIAYRILAGATAALVAFVVLNALIYPSMRRDLIDVWGLLFYLAALLLALGVEVVPARHAPKRDYGDVFR